MAGGFLGFRAYRNTQIAHADVGTVVHYAAQSYGGPEGTSSLTALRAAMAAHPIVGRSTAANALREEALLYVTAADRPRWWFGTHGNLALISRQVAERLSGKPFATFDGLRAAIWKEIGSVERVGLYQIHHKTSIMRGGAVYDFDNLVIVTPLCHASLLEGNYHYGR